MASNLERVGVILVAEGIGSFLSAVTDAGKAVVGFLGSSINIAGDFEQAMNKLGAVSGATAEEIGLISDKAKALGADLTLPATSAVDAGNAMLELSKAGFTVQQTMDAAKGTLQLAAAAGIEEAQAAEIAANAINAFGLEASQATMVADLLAATANASSVEITDVAASYKMAGAIFSAFQGPVVGAEQAMVDLTTAVGLLGNAGIKGSDAGTSLKQALLQLTGPSDKAKGLMRELAASIGETGDIAYTADGQMRSFPEILAMTAAATRNLTEEQRNKYITDIFGADASRAILILMQQGPDAWDKMTDAVTRQGAASDLATAQTKGFKGALEGAKSQLETLQLTIGEKFLPILADLLSNYISPGIAQLTAFTAAIFGSDLAFEELNPTLQAVVKWVDSAKAAWSLWEKGVISTRTALDTLIPGLGDRLGPAIDKVLGLVRVAAPAFQNLLAAFQTGGFAAIVTVFEDGTSALSSFLEKLGLSESVAIGVSNAVGTVISSFEKGGAVSQALGGYVDALSGRWNTFLGVATNVANGVLAVVMPVFGLVNRLFEEHGDEIVSVTSRSWESVNSIINKVVQIVGLVVGAGLTTIGGFLEKHGDKIYRVMETTWNLIASVVTTALNLIEGVVTMVLSALTGDWGAAHDALLNTSSDFVLNLGNVITKGLDFIASFFGTSLKEIGQTWSNNWDMLVQIVTKVVDRVRDVGNKIVDAIKSGFENAWSDFIKSAQGKLQEFRDMLPFSEPKDPSSPLYGLSKSGEAIVNNLAKGFTSNTMALLSAARSLGEQMIAQFGDDGRKAADALTSGMRDALDFRASIPRAMDSIDTFLKGVGERLRQTGMYSNVTEDVQRQVQQALGEAQKLSPKAAAEFFKLRTDQIKEMTALQEQLFTATDTEKGSLTTRIARIFEAQKLELQSFLSQIEGGGGIVSPPATLAQLLTGSNTVTNYGPQINYSPSYSGAPSSPTYDYAVLQALTP